MNNIYYDKIEEIKKEYQEYLDNLDGFNQIYDLIKKEDIISAIQPIFTYSDIKKSIVDIDKFEVLYGTSEKNFSNFSKEILNSLDYNDKFKKNLNLNHTIFQLFETISKSKEKNFKNKIFSINIEPEVLIDKKFLEFLKKLKEKDSNILKNIEFEILEKDLKTYDKDNNIIKLKNSDISKDKNLKNILNEFSLLGIKLGLDDVGAEQSNILRIKELMKLIEDINKNKSENEKLKINSIKFDKDIVLGAALLSKDIMNKYDKDILIEIQNEYYKDNIKFDLFLDKKNIKKYEKEIYDNAKFFKIDKILKKLNIKTFKDFKEKLNDEKFLDLMKNSIDINLNDYQKKSLNLLKSINKYFKENDELNSPDNFVAEHVSSNNILNKIKSSILFGIINKIQGNVLSGKENIDKVNNIDNILNGIIQLQDKSKNNLFSFNSNNQNKLENYFNTLDIKYTGISKTLNKNSNDLINELYKDIEIKQKNITKKDIEEDLFIKRKK